MTTCMLYKSTQPSPTFHYYNGLRLEVPCRLQKRYGVIPRCPATVWVLRRSSIPTSGFHSARAGTKRYSSFWWCLCPFCKNGFVAGTKTLMELLLRCLYVCFYKSNVYKRDSGKGGLRRWYMIPLTECLLLTSFSFFWQYNNHSLTTFDARR